MQLRALEKQRLKRMTAAAGTETGDADEADAAPAQAVAVSLTAMLCSWVHRECQDIWHGALCFRPWRWTSLAAFLEVRLPRAVAGMESDKHHQLLI